MPALPRRLSGVGRAATRWPAALGARGPAAGRERLPRRRADQRRAATGRADRYFRRPAQGRGEREGNDVAARERRSVADVGQQRRDRRGACALAARDRHGKARDGDERRRMAISRRADAAVSRERRNRSSPRSPTASWRPRLMLRCSLRSRASMRRRCAAGSRIRNLRRDSRSICCCWESPVTRGTPPTSKRSSTRRGRQAMRRMSAR